MTSDQPSWRPRRKSSVEDLRALANCAAGAQMSDKVIEICQKILQNDPDDVTAHSQLADAAAALQDYQTAMDHYNQAIQLAPDQGQLWKALVKVQTQADQEIAAFDTLRAAGQALPDDGDIQLSLGEVYLSQGAPTLALPCLRHAAELVESPAATEQVAIRLGQTLYQLGRLVEARDVLEPVYTSSSRANTRISSIAGRKRPGQAGRSRAGIYLCSDVARATGSGQSHPDLVQRGA